MSSLQQLLHCFDSELCSSCSTAPHSIATAIELTVEHLYSNVTFTTPATLAMSEGDSYSTRSACTRLSGGSTSTSLLRTMGTKEANEEAGEEVDVSDLLKDLESTKSLPKGPSKHKLTSPSGKMSETSSSESSHTSIASAAASCRESDTYVRTSSWQTSGTSSWQSCNAAAVGYKKKQTHVLHPTATPPSATKQSAVRLASLAWPTGKRSDTSLPSRERDTGKRSDTSLPSPASTDVSLDVEDSDFLAELDRIEQSINTHTYTSAHTHSGTLEHDLPQPTQRAPCIESCVIDAGCNVEVADAGCDLDILGDLDIPDHCRPPAPKPSNQGDGEHGRLEEGRERERGRLEDGRLEAYPSVRLRAGNASCGDKEERMVMEEEESDLDKFKEFRVTGVERVGHGGHSSSTVVLILQPTPFQNAGGSGSGQVKKQENGKKMSHDAQHHSNMPFAASMRSISHGGDESGIEKQGAGTAKEGVKTKKAVLHESWAAETDVEEGDTVVLVDCREPESDGAWHLRNNRGTYNDSFHTHYIIG